MNRTELELLKFRQLILDHMYQIGFKSPISFSTYDALYQLNCICNVLLKEFTKSDNFVLDIHSPI
jgi:hypothetical protein